MVQDGYRYITIFQSRRKKMVGRVKIAHFLARSDLFTKIPQKFQLMAFVYISLIITGGKENWEI